MWRANSLEKAAREGGHVQPDETVQAVALAEHGLPVETGLKGGSAILSRFALIATDRNLYAMKLGQIGFKSVKEVVLEVPLGEATVESRTGELKIGRRGGERALWIFKPARYFSGAKKLTAYVESHR